LLALSTVLGSLGTGFAEHYVNGVEGLKAASCPPPGFYYKNYTVLYTSDTIKNGNGEKRLASEFNPAWPATEVDLSVMLYANVSRFLWVSEKKILGGNFAADFFIPIISYDLELTVPGTATLANEHGYGFGDLILEPFVLAWHGPRWDAVAGVAVVIPTGDESLALGHTNQWTGLISGGATLYYDAKRTLHFAILPRLEVHSEDPAGSAEKAAGGARITRGADFHLEWGIGKTFIAPKYMVDVGVTGFAQWQITDDT
ncbi:MAG: transporter, partial [bacterium]|nr:transporter [bacterium]